MLFLLLRASGDISDCNWLQLEQNDTIDIKQRERMHIRNNICSTFNPKKNSVQTEKNVTIFHTLIL